MQRVSDYTNRSRTIYFTQIHAFLFVRNYFVRNSEHQRPKSLKNRRSGGCGWCYNPLNLIKAGKICKSSDSTSVGKTRLYAPLDDGSYCRAWLPSLALRNFSIEKQKIGNFSLNLVQKSPKKRIVRNWKESFSPSTLNKFLIKQAS